MRDTKKSNMVSQEKKEGCSFELGGQEDSPEEKTCKPESRSSVGVR